MKNLQESMASYEEGCNALATAFMHHIHSDLDADYKLGDMNDEYFIWSDTDYASFSDWSCSYVWDTSTMYTVLKQNIPYKTMCEHYDFHDDFKTPDGWIRLEIYAWKRKHNSDMTAQDFQRMLQREYYENRASNLSDEVKQRNDKYMSQAMETFKKDLADMRL